MTEVPRRRRRVRSGGSQPSTPTDPAATTSAVHDPDAETQPEERDTERGLRGLVGGGSSQVSIGAALRARDATRPSETDLAYSERNLMIIRRGWTPPPR